MNFDHDDFKERELKNQFYIPRKLEYLASYYLDIPWIEFKELYISIVKKYLITHNCEHLSDMPFGQGYQSVRNEFISALKDKEKNKIGRTLK